MQRRKKEHLNFTSNYFKDYAKRNDINAASTLGAVTGFAGDVVGNIKSPNPIGVGLAVGSTALGKIGDNPKGFINDVKGFGKFIGGLFGKEVVYNKNGQRMCGNVTCDSITDAANLKVKQVSARGASMDRIRHARELVNAGIPVTV
jgi:hypothetical protein